MFWSAISQDDARMEYAKALARQSQSMIDAVLKKKVKCAKCGKKFIFQQGVSTVESGGGFNLTCTHCGNTMVTYVIAPKL